MKLKFGTKIVNEMKDLLLLGGCGSILILSSLFTPRLANAVAFDSQNYNKKPVSATGIKTTENFNYDDFLYFSCNSSNNINLFGFVEALDIAEPLAPDLISRGLGNGPGGGTIQNGLIYYTNASSNNISIFSIDDQTGQLTPFDNSPFNYSVQSPILSFDPSGNFAYIVSSTGNSLNLFKVLEDGKLTPNYTSNYPNGKIVNIGYAPGALVFSKTINTAYIANASGNNITIFDYNPNTGELIPRANKVDTRGVKPSKIKIMNNKYLYVLNGQSDTVSMFEIDGNGGLSYMDKVSVVTGAVSINSGSALPFLFVSSGASRKIQTLAINSVTGVLTSIPGASVTTHVTQPGNIYVLGEQLFVIGSSNNSVDVFDIDLNSGVLTFNHSVAMSKGCYSPTGMAIEQEHI